ncbi:MAG: hypothetical protein OXN84_08145 [Albidovulum sp.]|nr:hypothetical protein [Albidovulum sp.]
MEESLPVDAAFASSRALQRLPNADILANFENFLDALSVELKSVGKQFGDALSRADNAITETRSRWNERRATIEKTYEKLLRELQNRRRGIYTTSSADRGITTAEGQN